MSRSEHIGRSAARTGVVTAVSRFMGMGRVLVISAVLGTTYLGNTFQSSNSVSNILFELLAAGGLSAVLVPALVRNSHSDADTERLANGVLGVATLVLGVIAISGVVFAPAIAGLLTSSATRYREEQRELSTFLIRWFMPQIVLYGLGAVATAVLHSRRRYAIAAAAPIASTLVMVVCFTTFRIHAGHNPGFHLDGFSKALLAIAGTGGVIAFVATLVIPARQLGIRLVPRLLLRDGEVLALLEHSGWGILLNSVGGLLAAALVVAGNAVEGGVVAFNIAWVLFLAPYAILSQPLASASLPELTEDAAERDDAALTQTMHWTLETMCALMAPATAVIVIFARSGSLGLHLASDYRGDMLVASALAGLAIGLVPYSAFLVLARVFYARDDSRTPALASVLCGAVGVLVIVSARTATDGRWLIGFLGIGHTVAYAVGAAVLGAVMFRRSRTRIVSRRSIHAIVTAVALAIPTWIISRSFDDADRVQSLVVAAVGSVAYGVAYVAALRISGFGSLISRTRPSAVTAALTDYSLPTRDDADTTNA